MALTPFRWAAIAVAAMLSLAILIFSDIRMLRPPELTEGQEREERLLRTLSHHSGRTNRFARHYRIAQLKDSLRPRAVSAPGAPGLRLAFGASVVAATRAAVDSALVYAREKIGPSPVMGVDVVAIVDSARINGTSVWPSGVGQVFILPERAGDRCVVVLTMGSGSSFFHHRTLASEDARQNILGPCAFYAAFGMPGDSIRSWLRARGATLALGGSWTRTPNLVSRDVGEGYYYVRSDTNAYFPGGARVLHYYSSRGIQCVLGDTEVCAASVLEPTLGARPVAVGPAMKLSTRIEGFNAFDAGVEYGGRETEMLADMLRSFGKDRFAQLWSSPDPLPVAFQRATGLSLGEWVATWAQELVPEIDRGPTIPAASLGSALAVVIASILLTVWMARRRSFA